MRKFIVILFVFIVACGGTTDVETADDAGQAAVSSGSNEELSDNAGGAAEGSDTTEADEPPARSEGGERLQDFFPFFSSDPAEAEAEYRRSEREAQEKIRACMAAEGFDYIPFVPDDSFFGGPGDDLPREEYVATYGLGISTMITESLEFSDSDVPMDPNQEMIEAMDDAEREAYFEALYGAPPTDEQIEAGEFEPSGCQSVAYQDLFAEDLFVELGPQLEELGQRMMADPRIVELEAEWAACMADSGFDFGDQEEMYEHVFQLMESVVSYPEVGADLDYEAVAPDEGFEEFGPQYDEAALAEVQDEEIAIAVADYQCSKGFEETFDEIAAEYEAEFIAENREMLEQLRDG